MHSFSLTVWVSMMILLCAKMMFVSSITEQQISDLSNDTITAIQSGEFHQNSTWNGNVIPGNGSTVIIPKNVTVNITNESFGMINIQSLRIYGKLEIGPLNNNASPAFVFEHPTNIMVFSGGILEDLTHSHVWSISTNTIITIYNSGSFNLTQPITFMPTMNNSKNETFSSSFNGPYTITIDLQGKIAKYQSITFVPCVSGDFGLDSTWLGGLAPTRDRCSPDDGGCDLIIPKDFNVTRANNRSTINGVNVYLYGFFEISSWSSYYFLYPIHFFVYNGGIFQDSTQNGFFFYVNSSFTIDNGGLFITHKPTYINSYICHDITMTQIQLDSSSINGPFSMIIDRYGKIEINNSSSTVQTVPTVPTVPTVTTKTTPVNISVVLIPSFHWIIFIILSSALN